MKVPEPAPLTDHGPARVIAVANQKGGVGKTTSTINLGAALAEYGRRVLLVDFDPQGALSVGLGVQAHELETTIYNLLMERGVEIDDVIRPTGVEGMDLLPSNIDLSAAEVQLVTEVGREQALGRAIKPVLDRYDVILIDCQPSLGLLTINALACADQILIPLACEFFSLRGVALLMDTIEKVQDRLNPDLKILGILATMFDPRTLHTREVRQRVIDAFGDLVFDAVINRTVRFPETTVAGEPITTWAPTSNGADAVPPAGARGHRPVTLVENDPPLLDAPSTGAAGPPRFTVRLHNFEGPFDLLLQLIGSRELDITEMALHTVTDDFIAHLTALGDDADLDETTEFLVVAATLLDLKAARLLPDAEVEDAEDLALLEARDLLFARLLQYRAYKQVAALFVELEAGAMRRFPRSVALEERFAALLPEVLLGVEPAAFAELAASVFRPKPPPTVGLDHLHAATVSVAEHAALLRGRLAELGRGHLRRR